MSLNIPPTKGGYACWRILRENKDKFSHWSLVDAGLSANGSHTDVSVLAWECLDDSSHRPVGSKDSVFFDEDNIVWLHISGGNFPLGKSLQLL